MTESVNPAIRSSHLQLHGAVSFLSQGKLLHFFETPFPSSGKCSSYLTVLLWGLQRRVCGEPSAQGWHTAVLTPSLLTLPRSVNHWPCAATSQEGKSWECFISSVFGSRHIRPLWGRQSILLAMLSFSHPGCPQHLLLTFPCFSPPIHSKGRIWSCHTNYFQHLHQIPPLLRSNSRSLLKSFQNPASDPCSVGKCVCHQPWQSEWHFWDLQDGKEKATTASCPLIFAHAVMCAHLHMYTHSQINTCNKNPCKGYLGWTCFTVSPNTIFRLCFLCS